MGGIVSGPKPAPVQAAPLPPAEDPDKLKKQDDEALRAARAAAQGGRASTILTSPLGVTGGASDAESFSKILLG